VKPIRCAVGLFPAIGAALLLAAVVAGDPEPGAPETSEALALALAPLPIQGESDRRIAALQAQSARDPARLERLGWAFAERAGESHGGDAVRALFAGDDVDYFYADLTFRY
jgi:hypothetical protein